MPSDFFSSAIDDDNNSDKSNTYKNDEALSGNLVELGDQVTNIQNKNDNNKNSDLLLLQQELYVRMSNLDEQTGPASFQTNQNDLKLGGTVGLEIQKFNEKFLKLDLNQTFREELRPGTTTTNAMNSLDYQVKNLQKLLMTEQDKFTQMSKKFHDSENQRLELISQTNNETFNLTTKFAKARNELEKSEALRQDLEYQLSLIKCSHSREKSHSSGKEKMLEDINKGLEDTVSVLKRDNQVLSDKVKNLEANKEREETELVRWRSLQSEQDDVINALKEEKALNKECVDKLKDSVEFYKEKWEQTGKTLDEVVGRVKELEESLVKERNEKAEIEKNHKRLEAVVACYEGKKLEIELNLEKLMEQLKTNRKEMVEEQSKCSELKERFKIVESHLSKSNEELSRKLEEKTDVIKRLSKELSCHEMNFKEIKRELAETMRKQEELDSVYGTSMKQIEQMKAVCVLGPEDIEYENFKSFQRQQHSFKMSQAAVVQPTLAYSLSQLRTVLDLFRGFFDLKSTELHATKKSLNTSEHRHLLNNSKVQECENLKIKYDREMQTLRNERVALEEVIASLRKESETLRSSLKEEFLSSNNVKAQLTRAQKEAKEGGDKKLRLLQSLYKRLLPVSVLGRKGGKSRGRHGLAFDEDVIRDEARLEEFMDKVIEELVESVRCGEEKVSKLEKECMRREEDVEKLSRVIREKEGQHSKQKDSLVTYYEQLLNDVNSRVKSSAAQLASVIEEPSTQLALPQQSTQPTTQTKSPDTNQSSLATTCILLIGLIRPLVQRNNDLKNQRTHLNNLYNKFLKQLDLHQQKSTNNVTKPKPTPQIQQNELAEAVDYSIESSIISNASDQEATEHDEESNIFENRTSRRVVCKIPSAIGRFRRVVILVLAARRLRLFAKQNVTDRVCFFKSHIESRFYTFSRVRSAKLNKSNESGKQDDELTVLKDLFSGGSDLNSIIGIADDLNKCLFESGNVMNAKEALLKCLTFIEAMNESHQMSRSNELAFRLGKGLDRLCKKHPKLAAYYSLRKRLASLGTNNLVSISDFDSICKELEDSLKREEQAQAILNAQSSQLEELSFKLAPYSTLEMQSVKLKEMVGEVTRKYQKKEKLLRHLQKKVSSMQVMKESYEKSAQSILMDKKLFLNYCRAIEGLVQNSLRPAINGGVESKEVLEIVRQISCVNFGVGYTVEDPSGLKLSPESLACQSIVNLFCITFNMLLVKLYCPVGVGDCGGLGSGINLTDGKVEENDSFSTLVSSNNSADSHSINFG